MKFILLSDVHLSWDIPACRLDDTRIVQLEKLHFILKQAMKQEARILQSGDLFDRPRSWYLLPEVIRIFKQYYPYFVSIFGQHDTYMYSDATRQTTNLGILSEVELIKIAGPDIGSWIQFEDSVVVGCSFGQDLDEKELRNLPNNRKKILIVHASISNESLYPGHEYTSAKKFLRKWDMFDLILCGDIHRAFIEDFNQKRFIVNTGPIIRRTADEYNFTHQPHFLIYDTNSGQIEKVEIPHQLSNKVMTRDHIERKSETEEMLADFINMVQEEELYSVSFEENLLDFIKKNNISESIVNIISEVMGE